MKAASLALACALLGATTLAPASFAQTSPGATQTPAEASPSTASPDASARAGTSAQRDWRDQEGRTGGWRSSRDKDNESLSPRGQSSRYANDNDDDDDMMSSGDHGQYGAGGTDHRGKHQSMHQGMHQRMAREGMGGMGMMHAPSGARLSLKRGESQISIRCPANENIAACVDAVGKLMDRAQALPQTSR